MASEKIKWYNAAWVLVIAGAVLAPIFTDLYNKVPIVTSFKLLWNFVINNLLYILNFEVKFWWLLILYVIYKTAKIINKNFLNKDDEILSEYIDSRSNETLQITEKTKRILAFKATKLGNIIWKWEWIYNNLIKEFEIKNLTPICPNTNCNNSSLKNEPFGFHQDTYRCPKCNQGVEFNYPISYFENQIGQIADRL